MSRFHSGMTKWPIERIVVPEGRRALDEENVLRLMASMKLIGLRQPINVLTTGENFGEYRLIAGRHRMEAARRLGWKEIECISFSGDTALISEIVEIVENLHRHNLSAAEEALAVARLAELSAKRDAEIARQDERQKEERIAANKLAPIERRRGGNAGVTGKKAGSTRDIAEKHGISKETVRKAKKRTEAIGVADLKRIAAQPQFDKPAAVDALAAMPKDEREETIAAAERGVKIALSRRTGKDRAEDLKKYARHYMPSHQPAQEKPLSVIAAQLPRLSADDRKQLRAMLDALDTEAAQ